MNILIAFDKFKDSMTATRACGAAEEGLREGLQGKFESLDVEHAPLTDGGEGFCRILTEVGSGDIEYHAVTGPLGEEIDAPIGWVDSANLNSVASDMLGGAKGRIAIIEMATAAGLEQVPFAQRHPSRTTTYGVGQLIRIAAKKADAILLGIGGSATSDLGLGALEALGLNFGLKEKITPSKWPDVSAISGGIPNELPPIYIACDVDNPLTGPNGAAAVYGPQKGLDLSEIEAFDQKAEGMAAKLCDFFQKPVSIMHEASAGAAGGIGFGLKLACGSSFVPGFELVEAWLDLAVKISRADVIVTGEGKFDKSSLAGKGPYALLEQALKKDKFAVVLPGALSDDARTQLKELFGDNVFACAITPTNMRLEDALERGPENLELTARTAASKIAERAAE